MQRTVYVKLLLCLLGTAALTVLGPAKAAYADEAIKTVSVTVTSSVEADSDGGSVSGAANSSKYKVVSCDFDNPKSSWKAGETPKVNIGLEAEEGYYFNSITGSRASIRNADFLYARKGSGNRSLTLVVKLKPVKGTLGAVEDAYWEDAPLGKAKWSKVDHADAYEVKLFCNDHMVYRVEKTTSAKYDFYSRMTEKGTYYFKVRAIARTESEADYLKAGDWAESDSQEITLRDAQMAESHTPSGGAAGGSSPGGSHSAGPSGNAGSGPGESSKNLGGPEARPAGWQQDKNGWWYENADHTYPVNCWQMINGKWYLFNMDGYMLTGWQKKNDRQYYLTSNGDMVAGWLQYNRTWYYLDPDLGMITGGWQQVDGDWYYMNPDGSMATGWIYYKENWYYLDPADGRMVRGRTVESYYVNADGIWVP